jgi:polyhydroxybutyrate depolymerase
MLVAAWMGLQLGCDQLLDTTPELPQLDDPCGAWDQDGIFALTVRTGRRPLVYVPPGLSEGPRDIVVMLHGAGGSPEKMLRETAFRQEADERGFVVVYPRGSGASTALSWNAGSCCGYAETVALDDVGFLEETVTLARERVCGDRVLAVGHSNGGMMAMRWACEGSGPDAWATSAAALLVDACDGDPVPIVAHHGDLDPIVPYDGGQGERGESFPSVAESMDAFLKRNACTEEPPVETIVGDRVCMEWDCDVTTRLCTLQDWEHKWPGGPGGDRETGPSIEPTILDWFETTPQETIR